MSGTDSWKNRVDPILSVFDTQSSGCEARRVHPEGPLSGAFWFKKSTRPFFNSDKHSLSELFFNYSAVGQVDVAVSTWNSQPFDQSSSQFKNPSWQIKEQVPSA